MGEIERPDKEDCVKLNLPCKDAIPIVNDSNWIGHMICIRSKCFHFLDLENENGSIEKCEIVLKQKGTLNKTCNHSCSKITRTWFPNVKVKFNGGIDVGEREE